MCGSLPGAANIRLKTGSRLCACARDSDPHKLKLGPGRIFHREFEYKICPWAQKQFLGSESRGGLFAISVVLLHSPLGAQLGLSQPPSLRAGPSADVRPAAWRREQSLPAEPAAEAGRGAGGARGAGAAAG